VNKCKDLESRLEEMHNAIHQICAALGKNAPDLSVPAETPLKVMLKIYETHLSKLQQEKEGVIRELHVEWTKLHELWDLLGTPRNPKDVPANMNVFDTNNEFSTIDEVRKECFVILAHKSL
jgi:hypothetical protein